MLTKVILGLDNISPGKSTGEDTIGGMRTYMQDVVKHLPLALPGVHVKFFTPSWSRAFTPPAGGSFEVVDCGNVPTFRPGRVWYEQVVLPGLIRKHGVDVWLGMNSILPLRIHCRAAMILQSFQYFTHPKGFYSWPQLRYLRNIVPASMRRADTVIVLTEASRAEIMNRCGIPEAKIRVIRQCLHDIFQPGSALDPGVIPRVLGSDDPYIFYLSALYPYKNHARLIEAFSRVHESFPRYKLLIAGSDTSVLNRSDLAAVAARFGIASKVILPGRIAQADVGPLYRGAAVTAMPSFDETFGLPVLEAMAFGCPVMTSNISAMAEVAGDAGVLVDPFSVDSMTAALNSILGSEEFRRDLSARGLARVAAEFTREKMMGKFADAIYALLPGQPARPQPPSGDNR